MGLYSRLSGLVVNAIRFAKDATALIGQDSAADTAGANFTIQAQGAAGANNGGTLVLAGGTSGSASAGGVQLQAGATVLESLAAAAGDFIAIGVNPAATGSLRVANAAQAVNFRNAANSADLRAILTDGANNIYFGFAQDFANSFLSVATTGLYQFGFNNAAKVTISQSATTLSNTLIGGSPPTIALGTGGTQTVPANCPPQVTVTSGTFTSNGTIDFSTNATSGIFFLDMSGVTLGASFGVVFKNGTATKTYLSSSVISGTLAIVTTTGVNTLAVNF
jgi:hypothetical protein